MWVSVFYIVQWSSLCAPDDGGPFGHHEKRCFKSKNLWSEKPTTINVLTTIGLDYVIYKTLTPLSEKLSIQKKE